jgi:5'-3' exonuclease
MKRLIVDMSSAAWTGLLAGKDTENGVSVKFEDKDVWVNSAAFGFENTMNHLVSSMESLGIVPSQVIMVIEGQYSKALRQGFLPDYKAGRDRPPESYEQFNLLKRQLVTELGNVGASMVTQDGVEADDVIAYLAQNLDGERYILSSDGDLSVLVGPGVHLIRRGVLDENPYGPFDNKYITLYKALVGDSSDNIPGAKGFGPKAFLDMMVVFGDVGLELMEKLIREKRIPELAEDVGDLKVLNKIIENEATVYASYSAAKLYPNRVNTLQRPLVWKVGMVKAGVKVDSRLKKWAAGVRLIHAGNYAEAIAFAKTKLGNSPFVSLDIETSVPIESDDWLRKGKGVDEEVTGVDVFGSKLTGMGFTFGCNSQFTYYFTVDHVEEPGIKNLTSDQVLDVVKLIPRGMNVIIQNVAFELPILYLEWGEKLKDNGFHGFLPNALDTKIMANYVDENVSSGLKKLSKLYLDYDQETYDEVTTLEGNVEDLPNGGWVVFSETTDTGMTFERRKYKMNELTANHVLGYGADDTICTSALYVHFRRIMEIEKTWDVFMEVEPDPSYLTALAFATGTELSKAVIEDMEKEDNAIYDEAWKTVRAYLIENGWEGTVCPVVVDKSQRDSALMEDSEGNCETQVDDTLTISDYKALKFTYALVTGEEFPTKMRTLSKIAAAMIAESQDGMGVALAVAFQEGNAEAVNFLIRSRFTGEPILDINSPKQMQKLLYGTMGIPARIINKVTDAERKNNPDLSNAVSKYNRIRNGSSSAGSLDAEELKLIALKAKTDDTAIDSALAFDRDQVNVPVLEAIKAMKTVDTRRKLYYRPYLYVKHWSDGRVHANVNQCATVTRRYSSSSPNLQQLPKRGDGVRFRGAFIPHRKDAVICSIDFSGQELRLMAGQSGDRNMMACYVGDKLKDIHSITASGAMASQWGKGFVSELKEKYGQGLEGDDATYDLFIRARKSADPELHKKADDLRKTGKNVNFAAQFDAQAPKLADMLIIPLPEAQAFLDAKYAMFPRVETWKEEVRNELMSKGYVTTMMGGRRHLRTQIGSDNKWERERAGRQGPNFKIQGSGAEMTKLAMGRVWQSGICQKLDMVFIAPIHDELVWSVSYDDALESIRVIHGCMTKPYSTLPVPVVGSISLGVSFGDQIECGDYFDDAAIANINKVIADLRAGV